MSSSVVESVDPVISTVIDGSAPAAAQQIAPAAQAAPAQDNGLLARAEQRDAPYCYQCGNAMQRAGSCYVCSSCGTTSGCS